MTSITSRDDRLRRSFAFFDENSNGAIEHDDVIAMAARVTKAFDEAPDSPKAREIGNAFELFWNALVGAVDLDGDRQISPSEYLQGMVGAFAENGDFDRAMQPMVVALLAIGDVDDDGVLSREEFQRLQGAIGNARENSVVGFDKIDLDGSGTLTVDELTTAAREYHTGTDPDAVGNWLFGPV